MRLSGALTPAPLIAESVKTAGNDSASCQGHLGHVGTETLLPSDRVGPLADTTDIGYESSNQPLERTQIRSHLAVSPPLDARL